jgi:JmjC domain, hydroxylase
MDPIGLSELPGNQLQHLEIPGMSSDYIYLGAPGSLFTMHLEDYNVHSFNYLRSGEPKRWVVVNPGSRTKFENVIKGNVYQSPTDS